MPVCIHVTINTQSRNNDYTFLFQTLAMPLSTAERTKCYRERLREKLGDRPVKAQDAARKAESRRKTVEVSREKERERQRRCRAKKTESNAAKTPTTDSPVYKVRFKSWKSNQTSARQSSKVTT